MNQYETEEIINVYIWLSAGERTPSVMRRESQNPSDPKSMFGPEINDGRPTNRNSLLTRGIPAVVAAVALGMGLSSCAGDKVGAESSPTPGTGETPVGAPVTPGPAETPATTNTSTKSPENTPTASHPPTSNPTETVAPEKDLKTRIDQLRLELAKASSAEERNNIMRITDRGLLENPDKLMAEYWAREQALMSIHLAPGIYEEFIRGLNNHEYESSQGFFLGKFGESLDQLISIGPKLGDADSSSGCEGPDFTKQVGYDTLCSYWTSPSSFGLYTKSSNEILGKKLPDVELLNSYVVLSSDVAPDETKITIRQTTENSMTPEHEQALKDDWNFYNLKVGEKALEGQCNMTFTWNDGSIKLSGLLCTADRT